MLDYNPKVVTFCKYKKLTTTTKTLHICQKLSRYLPLVVLNSLENRKEEGYLDNKRVYVYEKRRVILALKN